MRWKKWTKRAGAGMLVLSIVLLGIFWLASVEYGSTPDLSQTVNSERRNLDEYDLWGQGLSQQQARRQQESGQPQATAPGGAVRVDDELLELGRKAFYEETFGNERFLSDVLGLMDGPLNRTSILGALAGLGGQGTENLKITAPWDFQVGDRIFREGDTIETGLDVVRGEYFPLGLKVNFGEGRIRIGITCALCHSTVEPDSHRLMEGVPNPDLRLGLLMALASNSSAYFVHTDVDPLSYTSPTGPTVTTSEGKTVTLPNPDELERAVDRVLMKWPPGSFDSTVDRAANPAQVPDCFTQGDHPYGWSGFAMAGPFNGLSGLTNNVHALNSDALTNTDLAEVYYGMDREVYLGILLQNAPSEEYRYNPSSGQSPSEFFSQVDPNPNTPGLNQIVTLPDYPRATPLTPHGLAVSSPGQPFWRQVNAMSAFQNSLSAPVSPDPLDEKLFARGKEVFQRAGCVKCHSGPAFTNNRIIPQAEVGTEPSRAKALAATEPHFQMDAEIYSFETPVPLPDEPEILPVPTDHLERQQVDLAFGFVDGGGYKVKGLLGLAWTAPYLHDGGVALGPDPEQELGLPGTLLAGKRVDAAASLKALIDRDLREQVVQANREADLARVNVLGVGHHYWVDSQAGFEPAEQEALIHFLLHLTPEAGLPANEE